MLGVETAPIIGGPSPFMNSDLFDADDDSDEEVVRVSKPKFQSRPTKSLRLILSDDEDEENDQEPVPPSDSEDEKEADTNSKKPTLNGHAKTKKASVIQDSESDDDSDDADTENKRKEEKQKDNKKKKDDSSDDGSSTDDSDEDGRSDKEDEEEEEEIAFQLSPVALDSEQAEQEDGRPSRRKRVKKDELQKIHSETQRIVRESAVRIPYHRPKPLTLDELFNKKPSPATLKPIRGKVPRYPCSQQHISQPDKTNSSVSDELPDVLSSQSAELTQGNIENSSDADSSSVTQGNKVENTVNDRTTACSSNNENGALANKDDACEAMASDETLPMEINDSIHEQNIDGNNKELDKSEVKTSAVVSDESHSESLDDRVSKDSATSSVESTPKSSHDASESVPIHSNIPSESVQNLSHHLAELTPNLSNHSAASTPKLSNHSSKLTQEPPHNSTDSEIFTTPSQRPTMDGRREDFQFKTPSPAVSRLANGESAQARKMRLLQESLSRLKGLKPKLSGSPHATIDLDEDKEPSPEQKGMAKLMKRFEHHTRTIKPQQKKDVQVNIVTKEKGEDGKVDLKHRSFTVGLDTSSEELDPALKIPGAKLTHLKATLATGIRARREQERKKRVQAFQLDNEEGFGAEDEDEAELTGSETEEDEEDGGDAGIDENEDEDADYEPGNEFVDDEAESDDDDDADEGDYEDEDEDDESALVDTLKKKEKKKQIKSKPEREKKSGLDSDDDEISPSRKKKSNRSFVVEDDDEDDGDMKGKPLNLRLNSVDTDDTDAELNDYLQGSGRYSHGFGHRPASVLDQSSKTMEMFDSGTNSTVISDHQPPIGRGDLSAKKVTWSAGRDTDSSKDSTGFTLPCPVRQDSNSNSLDTSFDLMTSLIPAHQPEGGMRRSGRASVDSVKESFTPFSRHTSILGSISSKSTSEGQLNPLSLPVEDTQDLFRDDSPTLPNITDSEQVGETQSFHFSFEDETQTQFLDENGLLNVKTSSSKSQPKSKSLFAPEESQKSESQSSMDELLGLCSGRFTETQGKANFPKLGSFSQVSQRDGTQANMNELIGLCSGTFTEQNATSQVSSTRRLKDGRCQDDVDKDETASTSSFHIVSDPDGPDSDDDDKDKCFSSDEEDDIGFRKKKRRNDDNEEDEEDNEDREDVDNDSDNDNEEDEDDYARFKKRKRLRRSLEEEGVDEENDADNSDLDSEFAFDVNKKAFKGKTYGKQFKIGNFLEEEAELSGSEMGSDEDYDAEDEPDEEDLEGIVHEEVGDEEELRDQVNKVHMKSVDDEDARRLRLIKEMILPDGDLHSDNKRIRRFRWRNLDTEIDMARPNSEGEENEEDGQEDQDTQWRLKRYEREQWLKENQDKDKTEDLALEEIVPVEEDSQFAKCLVRTASFRKNRAETQTPLEEPEEKKDKEKEKKVSMTKPLRILNKRGSFLNRNKNDLAKMASMLKPVVNPQGPKNQRNFVFQSAESMNEESNTASEPPKVKRSISHTATPSTPSSAGPKPKKPRLERSQSQFTQNSVFSHF